MLKLCSCFKANNDDRKKHKLINKDNDVKSKGEEDIGFGFFLSGDDESGKTKMIEELVDSYNPFTRQEKISKTSEIERYIRDSLTDILRAFNQSSLSIQLEYPENHWRVTYILTTAHETDFKYSLEFFEHVEILWADAGLQEFMKKSNRYRFPDSAKYFLDQVSRIRDPDYIPTTEDMIYSRLFSSRVFKKSFDLKSERVRFNLLEMDLLHEEQQESIQSVCNKSNAIIFITDCSCFDVVIDEKKFQTRLHQSLERYKMIRNNKLLETTPVILILNKQDLLAKKIKSGVRLEDYFPDFTGYVFSGLHAQNVNSDDDPEVTRAKHFIEHQFLKDNLNNCYRHFTCDSDITVRLIFDDFHAIYDKMVSQYFEQIGWP